MNHVLCVEETFFFVVSPHSNMIKVFYFNDSFLPNACSNGHENWATVGECMRNAKTPVFVIKIRFDCAEVYFEVSRNSLHHT